MLVDFFFTSQTQLFSVLILYSDYNFSQPHLNWSTFFVWLLCSITLEKAEFFSFINFIFSFSFSSCTPNHKLWFVKSLVFLDVIKWKVLFLSTHLNIIMAWTEMGWKRVITRVDLYQYRGLYFVSTNDNLLLKKTIFHWLNKILHHKGLR